MTTLDAARNLRPGVPDDVLEAGLLAFNESGSIPESVIGASRKRESNLRASMGDDIGGGQDTAEEKPHFALDDFTREYLGTSKKSSPQKASFDLDRATQAYMAESVAEEKPVERPDGGSDVARGFSTAMKQIPQLGYGLLAGAGAVAESVLGEGGVASSVKKFGVDKYNASGAEMQKTTKESDSLTYSWDQAKQGDFGALVDWMQYGIGYGGAQAIQALATGGIGAVGGKMALKTVAETAAAGMVKKEMAAIAIADVGKTMTAEAAMALAVKNVASKIGQTTAIGAQAFGMEGGEIFGDLASDSEKRGTPLAGSEMAKAFGATLAAGGLEFVGDKLGFDLMVGKSKLFSPAGAMTGLTGKAARAGVAAVGAIPIEAGTEYLQTGFEEYGKGNEQNILPFNQSAEAQKQAFDAAGLGGFGGGVMAVTGGAVSSPEKAAPASPPRITPEQITAAITDPAIPLDEAIARSAAATDLDATGATHAEAVMKEFDALRAEGDRAAEAAASQPTASGLVTDSSLPLVGQAAPAIDAQPIVTSEAAPVTSPQSIVSGNETDNAERQAYGEALVKQARGELLTAADTVALALPPSDVRLQVAQQNSKANVEPNQGTANPVSLAVAPSVAQQQLADNEAGRYSPARAPTTEQLFTEDAPVFADETVAPVTEPTLQGTPNVATTAQAEQSQPEAPAAPSEVANPHFTGAEAEAPHIATLLQSGEGVKVHAVTDINALPTARGALAGARMSRHTARAIKSVMYLFGRKVQFYEASHDTHEGVMHDGKTIYVNVDGGIDAMAVAGHEFTHTLKHTDPEAYGQAHAAVVELLTNSPERRTAYAKYLNNADITAENTSELAHELLADIGGNEARTGAFWGDVFDQIHRDHPHAAARAIITRLRDALVKFINKLIMATPKSGFEHGFKREELTAVREHLVKMAKDSFVRNERQRLGLPVLERDQGKGEVRYSPKKPVTRGVTPDPRDNMPKVDVSPLDDGEKYYKRGLVQRPEVKLSPSRLTQAWLDLTKNDEVFDYPKSGAKRMEDIAATIARDLTVVEIDVDETFAHGWLVYNGPERIGEKPDAYLLHYADGKMELNVAPFGEANEGSRLYSIAGTYAHNNGLVFAGDRQGISEKGIERRLENMISLALKFKSTDFLLPHPDMELNWKEGDFEHNMETMLNQSYANAIKQWPWIKDYYYDFDTGTFRDNGGNAVALTDSGENDFQGGVQFAAEVGSGSDSSGRVRRPGEKYRTEKRAIFTHSVLRATSGEGRGAILDGLSQGQASRLGKDYKGVAYSTTRFVSHLQDDERYHKDALVKRPTVQLSPARDSISGMADKDTVAGTQAPTSAGEGSSGSAKKYDQRWMDNDMTGLAERVKRVAYAEDSYRLPNLENAVPASMVPKQAKKETVVLFRGVPSRLSSASIRPGDWVAIDKAYAQEHGTGETGRSKVVSIVAPASDVVWAGTDMNEYFYAPRNLIRPGERALDALNRLGAEAFDSASPHETSASAGSDVRFSAQRLSEAFEPKLREHFKSEHPQIIRISDNTPATLQLFGWADMPVVIQPDVIDKMHFEHGMTIPQMANLPFLLQRPMMIFGDAKNNSLVFIGEQLKPGKPVLVAVKPVKGSSATGRQDTAMIVTGYDPQNGWDEVAKRLMRGELVYRDTVQEGPASLKNFVSAAQNKYAQGSGRLLPRELLQGRGASVLERAYNVLGQSDLVNLEKAIWPDGVKFSTPRSATTGQQIQQAWQAPDNLGAWDNFVRAMQDKLVDTKRVVAEIRKVGIAIKDNIDPYLQEVLYHGRAAKRVSDFADAELRPLLIEMHMRGIDRQIFEDYLWARHATERNAQIAKVNPGMPDSGSGLSNVQAADILAGQSVTIGGRVIQLDLAKTPGYQALAKRIDAITKETTDTLVRYGLETQETVDSWRSTYGNYVPLMRDMESDDNYSGAFGLGLGTGQGFSVKGSASKRAMGSERGVIDILANVAMQRERAIVRGEKNRVAQALYGLSITAPNPAFWLPLNPDAKKSPSAVIAELVAMGINPLDAANIANEPKQRYTDPKTGMVMERINPQLRTRGDVLALRVNGKDRYVMFSSDERAQQMVAGLKNLDAEQLGLVMQKMAVVTRWFAAINTQFNPVFGLTNGVRDIGTGMLNLSSTELKGHQAEVFKNAFSALRGVYADLRDHRAGRAPTSKWALAFEEFASEGGQTGYRDMFQTSKERTEGLMKELKDATKGKTLLTFSENRSPLFGWLSDYNTAIENAVRLSAYQAAKDKGMTKQQAASLAKNLTVNFNKKGLAATQLGAMYAFFNAAVQGTARIGTTMITDANGKPSLSVAGKKILYGGMMAGVLQAVMFAAAGYDDEEPPQFAREKNFIIPDFIFGSGKYASIPYPMGFHVIPNIGRIATEFALSGFKKPGQRMVDMFSMVLDGFNPIGGSSGGISQLLSPTVTDPLVALSENKDWTGKSIFKEDFNKMHPTAGWTRKKDSASIVSNWLAYGTNYVTGGGKYEIGLLSPTPDQLDYLIGQATGGVGREGLKAWQFGATALSGEDMPMYKIPVAGRFVGETTGQASETSKFYNSLKRIGAHKSAMDEMKDAGDFEARKQYLADNPDAKLVKLADDASRELSDLKKRKRLLLENGASQGKIKLIETITTNYVKKANARLSEAR